MILYYLMKAVIYVTGFIPKVTIASIPYAGSFMASTLTTVVGVWNSFLDTFPYAIVAWHMFLFVILPFEVIMLVMKFFLGHRTPSHFN